MNELPNPELPKSFDPANAEPKWAERWFREPFRADASSSKAPFTIVIPPPNVTGSLHLGHALDNTLIDTLIRYKRMAGFEALYLPGTDHAGISTQVVVERQLKAEEKTRFDLGREKFLERVWDWKRQSGGEILEQLRRLGVSADWTRERFTMDEGLSRAVRHQFVKLYHDGLAYRGERIVNWDVAAQTTLSELEIDREERKGQMSTLRYLLADPATPASNGEAGEILIATVRPETIFADQAIAVHPDDERFAHLIGLQARIPLTRQLIPIIADEAVEMGFGVGALKITPAHDPTDFEIGERHGLERPSVIDLNGNLTGPLVPEEFRGMERFAARKAVVKALEAAGALVEQKDHITAIGISERTKVAVEPIVSTQWFVNVKPLAARVLEGLDAGDMVLLPERYTKVNRDWLENIRDWNISRQLWWGHQIPAWYDEQGNVYVPGTENPDLDCDQDPQYAHLTLRRDPDVFDTWFSSNLWPFSTLGWPDLHAEDFQKFYPTQVLVTGYDILFFWVARMMMFGLYAAEADGRSPAEAVPFTDVFLHGLLRDAEGRKMSKSRGNGIDPIEWMDTYGADAVRFTLARSANPGADLSVGAEHAQASRNFTTKLFNATRLGLMNGAVADGLPDRASLTDADRWILDRLDAVVRDNDALLDRFEIGKASELVFHFAWDEVCDWYLELAKVQLGRDGDEPTAPATRAVLGHVLEHLLRLLHPTMPFVTETLWTALTGRESVVVADWPTPSGAVVDAVAAQRVADLQRLVTEVRRFRADQGLRPTQKVAARLTGLAAADLEPVAAQLLSLGRLDEPGDGFAATASIEVRLSRATVLVELDTSGTIDLAAERRRLDKELAAGQKELTTTTGKLGNAAFLGKAPEDVVAKIRARQSLAIEEIDRVTARLAGLGQA